MNISWRGVLQGILSSHLDFRAVFSLSLPRCPASSYRRAFYCVFFLLPSINHFVLIGFRLMRSETPRPLRMTISKRRRRFPASTPGSTVALVALATRTRPSGKLVSKRRQHDQTSKLELMRKAKQIGCPRVLLVAGREKRMDYSLHREDLKLEPIETLVHSFSLSLTFSLRWFRYRHFRKHVCFSVLTLSLERLT